jgi:DNA adenine methylase
MTLSLLTRGIVNNAIISDSDPLINAFWSVLFKEPLILIDFIEKVPVNLKSFYKFKEISRKPKAFSKYDRAKSCLFLNRTSFSGIIASAAGPIGGHEQKSEYTIDCRFNRTALIEKIEYISTFKKQIIVMSSDWKKAISYAQHKYDERKKSKKLFFYLDPPFYHKAESLYQTYFKLGQHDELAKYLKKFRAMWILSYDNTPEIKKLYAAHSGKSLHIEMPYSINSHAKRNASELIITPLKLPHSLSRIKGT